MVIATETITVQEAQQMLAVSKGAKIVTFTALTIPDCRKTGNPYYGNIQKLARVNGIVNWQYTNAVNNRRVKEGKEADFEALPRQWGTRLKGLPFVSHVTKAGDHRLYLEVKVERSLGHEYQTLDGITIPEESVTPFLSSKSKNPRQGVDKEIILRDYDVSTIQTITINGVEYTIS